MQFDRNGFTRRFGLAGALALCGAARLARAQTIVDQIPDDPIYTGQAMVTGTDHRDRPRGLALCLGQVLIKVSGDPNIEARPGFAALAKAAPAMVTEISYWDRMNGMPKHDEQGTRDRPFILTALFDKDKIAAALAKLGSRPWTGHRPTVFLIADVHSYIGHFTLTEGSAVGYDQQELMRAAIADSEARTGLRAALPASVGATAPPGMFAVGGSLTWSDVAEGWIVRWGTVHDGRVVTWGPRGVSFDDAFDSALLGALAILSGHQPPRG